MLLSLTQNVSLQLCKVITFLVPHWQYRLERVLLRAWSGIYGLLARPAFCRDIVEITLGYAEHERVQLMRNIELDQLGRHTCATLDFKVSLQECIAGIFKIDFAREFAMRNSILSRKMESFACQAFYVDQRTTSVRINNETCRMGSVSI